MFPSLSIHAYVLHSAGDDDDARTLVREILERLDAAGPVLLIAASAEMITTWLEVVGQDSLKALLESHRAETKWLTAARAIAEGALDQALELYHEVESLPDVALMHRFIAESLVASGRRVEADTHLAEALAFYRSVGATHFIRQAEQLLPASA